MAVTVAGFYKDNDTVVELDGLQNAVTSAYLNSATVSASVVDEDDTEVVSSQTLSYVATSDGDYRAVIDQALFDSLTIGYKYYFLIVSDEGGVEGSWRVPKVFGYRES